jgi:sugar lactone lactonase YvrE
MRWAHPLAVIAVAVVAGCGGSSPAGPPPASSPPAAPIVPGDILDVAALPDGTLVLADRTGGRLLRRTPGGEVSVWVRLPSPRDIARAADGSLYVAAAEKVVRVAPDGTAVDVATLPAVVLAVAVGPDGALYACEDGVRIHRVDPATGGLTAVAGSGTRGYGGDGGPAATARFDGVHGMLPLADGRLLLSDSGNHRVREVRGGAIRTVAGTGRETDLSRPSALALAPDGAVLVAAFGEGTVRRLAPDGRLSVYAEVDAPAGLDVAPDGTAYVTSIRSRTLHRIAPSGGEVTQVPLVS